jgi:hypothetical protein
MPTFLAASARVRCAATGHRYRALPSPPATLCPRHFRRRPVPSLAFEVLVQEIFANASIPFKALEPLQERARKGRPVSHFLLAGGHY